MDIGTAFSFIEYLTNKSGSGGYIPPAQRTMLAQRAEIEFVSKYYNNVKQYDRNDKTPIYGYADTQRVYDNLRPYINSVNLVLTNGQAILPKDFLHPVGLFSSLVTTTTKPVDSLDCGRANRVTATTEQRTVDIRILTPDKYGYRLTSALKPPTPEYPIAKIQGQVIYLAPANVYPRLDYIRQPKGAVYNYIQNGNEKPVYDPNGSSDWEAPEDCHNELCTLVMQYVGIHVSGDMITEFSRFKESSGI